MSIGINGAIMKIIKVLRGTKNGNMQKVEIISKTILEILDNKKEITIKEIGIFTLTKNTWNNYKNRLKIYT